MPASGRGVAEADLRERSESLSLAGRRQQSIVSTPMEREQLKATLQELHDQLESGEPIDPEVQALLVQISADVNQKLASLPTESGQVSPGLTPEEKDGLLDRLLSLTDEFEESHPQLAETIGRVATALSRIGI